MINFIKITATDTFSYRSLDFDFRTGLSAIEGVNGSSKSSIFMALCQGLFNRNPKGCKVEEVNNYVTGQPYEITIWFSKEKDEYVVCNSRKLGKIKVSLNGRDISQQRVPENLALISEILGTDYTTFTDLVYQSKDTTLNILETSTDKGRKEFIARNLKLNEIDAEFVRMKDKEKELAGKNGRITLLTGQIQMLESSRGTLLEIGGTQDIAPTEIALQELNTEVEKITSEVIRLTSEVSEIDKEVKAWQAEASRRGELARLTEGFDADLVVDQEACQRAVNEAMSELSKIHVLRDGLLAKQTQLEKYDHVIKRRIALEAEIAELPVPEMVYQECRKQYEKISVAQSARMSKSNQDKTALSKFEQAAAKGVCPTCGGHADVTAQITALKAVIEEDAAYLRKCQDSIVKYENWIKQWETFQAADQKLQKLLAEESGAPEGDLDQVKRELAELRVREITAETEHASAKYDQQQANEHEKRRTKILELAATINQGVECRFTEEYAEFTREELRKAKGIHSILHNEIRALKTELDKLKEHNAKVRATVALNHQVTEANSKVQLQIEHNRKELELCEDKLARIKSWQGILGSKGYRVARIRKFIASLNQLMAKYAQMISSGRIRCNFFITETGEIDFTLTDEAKEMSYELWSGGEKARVKLVCLFAILELLESMGSLSFNVLALDEIFDQLDTEGKEGLFNILTYLKGHNKAIYTIAHSDLALDMVYDYKVKAVKLHDGTTEVKYE